MTTLGFIWRNLFRKQVRAVLTILSLIIAFLLYTYLQSIAAIFEDPVLPSGANRLQTQAKYSVITLLPESHLNWISSLDGVELVTHMTWFGGAYQNETQTLPIFPVEPQKYFDLYDEYKISEEHLKAFLETRTGAIVPARMLEEYGWQIGDKIPIQAQIWPNRTTNPRIWHFDLVGTYTSKQSSFEAFLFRYDYFDEARQYGKGTVGWLGIRVNQPERIEEIAQEIDKFFENSNHPTRTMTEAQAFREWMAQIGDIGFMMNGIMLAVFFTILLATGNTMAQSFRERKAEIGVLKTLGFSDMKISFYMLCESLLLCCFGGALGIGLAAASSYFYVQDLLAGFNILFILSVQAVLTGIAIMFFVGFIVGLLPAQTALRLSITDALRQR